MNGIQRRLLRAYIESGGNFEDEDGLSEFTSFVRGEVLLLSPRVRRAIELALDGREDRPHAVIATRLVAEEGRRVTVPTVRQRISRGARVLEAAIRARRWRPDELPALDGYASAPPPFLAPPSTRRAKGFASLNGRRETRESHIYP